MRKIEDSIGLGCLWALVSVALSLWAEVPIWPGFLLSLVLGFGYMFYVRSADEKDQAREKLLRDLVSRRVAASNGWDLRDYEGREANELYAMANARSHIADNFYDFAATKVHTKGGHIFRARIRKILSGDRGHKV